MSDAFTQFASHLRDSLLSEGKLTESAQGKTFISTKNEYNQHVNLDLTPFEAVPAVATAEPYFAHVESINELLQAYMQARQSSIFEADINDAMRHVSRYSQDFVQSVLSNAKSSLSDNQARLIAQWVQNFDVYAAVKAVESLIYSQADLKLLEIAAQRDWFIHFDHLAIRCGSRSSQDAERVVKLLKEHHGYVSTHNPDEAFYQFSDGWNAYPLYKILNNGQVIRLFIDQSDSNAREQIIQHWNRVYGYTAHHLAIRASRIFNDQRVAIDLKDLIGALQAEHIEVLTPTGEYTQGLLQQVFTKPEKNKNIPADLLTSIKVFGDSLEQAIENAKLLEVVSRKEMRPALAKAFFALYGIEYDINNPLHSAPIYQYFLPAQAAHVIKTSVQTA